MPAGTDGGAGLAVDSAAGGSLEDGGVGGDDETVATSSVSGVFTVSGASSAFGASSGRFSGATDGCDEGAVDEDKEPTGSALTAPSSGEGVICSAFWLSSGGGGGGGVTVGTIWV